MASDEGEFPKVGNDPVYASEANNPESYSNIAKNMIQTTYLTQVASLEDINYNFGQSDVFTDSTGFNNTVDETETTASFLGSAYVIGGSVYDTFDVSGINFTLWVSGIISTGPAGTAEFFTNTDRLEMAVADPGAADSNQTDLDTVKKFYDYMQWTASKLDIPPSTSSATITVGSTVIVDVGLGATYDDYTTGVWELIKVSGLTHNLYKNDTYVRTLTSALSGTVRFQCYMQNEAADTAEHDIDSVFLGHFAGSNSVNISGTPFNNNILGVFTDVKANLSGLGTDIQVDISSDGGANYNPTDQNIGSWVAPLTTGDTVSTNYNLIHTGSFTPFLFGYGYVVSE